MGRRRGAGGQSSGAETVLNGERRSSRDFWSGGREEKEAALAPRLAR